ncbi:hypothetical protein M8J77_007373 [Diaphorina citri]|nr:hypothetical protein M8J77_007373 [Diaphorina citri]
MDGRPNSVSPMPPPDMAPMAEFDKSPGTPTPPEEQSQATAPVDDLPPPPGSTTVTIDDGKVEKKKKEKKEKKNKKEKDPNATEKSADEKKEEKYVTRCRLRAYHKSLHKENFANNRNVYGGPENSTQVETIQNILL